MAAWMAVYQVYSLVESKAVRMVAVMAVYLVGHLVEMMEQMRVELKVVYLVGNQAGYQAEQMVVALVDQMGLRLDYGQAEMKVAWRDIKMADQKVVQRVVWMAVDQVRCLAYPMVVQMAVATAVEKD